MPMTFTDDLILRDLVMRNLSIEGTLIEKRERLAQHIETKYGDHLEALEIRTGKPWNEICKEDIKKVAAHTPAILKVPAVMLIMLGN